jgi:hypothetical protein
MIELKESVCACTKCKSACLHSPCFPTPEEVNNLVALGYKKFLSPVVYSDAAFKALKDNMEEVKFWLVVIPKSLNKGLLADKSCIMFNTTTGNCSLHKEGLKPFEGRHSHHTHTLKDTVDLREFVCNKWNSPEGEQVLMQFGLGEEHLEIFRAMGKEKGPKAQLLAFALMNVF